MRRGGCGNDPVNYGQCSGCRVDIDGVFNQEASDVACNCEGYSGKFCYVADPGDSGDIGVCQDKRPCDNDPYLNGCQQGSCSVGEYCSDECFCEPARICDNDDDFSNGCQADENDCEADEFCDDDCYCQPDPTDPTCGGATNRAACDAFDGCPNSAGDCQSRDNVVTGDCSNNYCNNKYSALCQGDCAVDHIQTSDTFNRCIATGISSTQATCETSAFEMHFDYYISYCHKVNDISIWQIDTRGASCPVDLSGYSSYLDTNGLCSVGTIGNPEICEQCDPGFRCVDGKCSVGGAVCNSNSSCSNGECIQNNSICECCCRVDNSAQDCCLGLTCEPGGCGDDPANYGLCTGCRVVIDGALDQTASDLACNCYGGTDRTCVINSEYPSGYCDDIPPTVTNYCTNDYPANPSCSSDENCIDGVEECNISTCLCEELSPCEGIDDNILDTCTDDNNCSEYETCRWDTCKCVPIEYCDGNYPDTGACDINNNSCNSETQICNETTCICEPLTRCTNNLSVCDSDNNCDLSREFCNDGCFCESLEPCDDDNDIITCGPDVNCDSTAQFCNDDCFCQPYDTCDDNNDPFDNCGFDNCADTYYCDDSDCLCKPRVPCDTDGDLATCDLPDETLCDVDTQICNEETCLCEDNIGGPEDPCIIIGTCDSGNKACQASYECLSDVDDCLCCCDPLGENTCADPLVCTPNMSDCSGATRGLCCGCSDDAQCGGVNQGCGSDTCCHDRPTVAEIDPTSPADDDPAACNNLTITVEFNERMDLNSFSNNFILLGDYRDDVCPDNTRYITQKPSGSERGLIRHAFAKLTDIIKKLLTKLLPAKFAAAYTDANLPDYEHTYCKISGRISGVHTADDTSILEFTPSGPLDNSRLYYGIVLDGVENELGIGLNGDANTGSAYSFNSRNYVNSYIWSFRTIDDQGVTRGTCAIERIELKPADYLFKTTVNDLSEADTEDTVKDSDKIFVAYAKNKSGQILSPTDGYDWIWSWTSSYQNVADIVPGVFDADSNTALVRASPTITEGTTGIIVRAEIIASTYVESPIGKFYYDTANTRVFLCDNPWPPPLDNGTWIPWQDGAPNPCNAGTVGSCPDTNYELFYCRDEGKAGSYDDLPAILDETIVRYQTSDYLKEAYYFREALPSATTTLAATDGLIGNMIVAGWNNVAGSIVAGYKLYWGSQIDNYDNNVAVNAADSSTGNDSVTCDPSVCAADYCCEISNLDNNKIYFFNITSFFETGAESGFHGVDTAMPTDSIAPNPPTNLLAVPLDAQVKLSWATSTPDDDVGKYRIYYSATADTFGDYAEVSKNNNIVIIDELTNGQTYYFTVTSIDEAGNESDKPESVSAIPDIV